MKSDRRAFEKFIHRHLGLFGSPSPYQLDTSRARIHEWLATHRDAEPTPTVPVSRHRRVAPSWRMGIAVAATLTLFIAVVGARPLAAGRSLSRGAEMILALFRRGITETRGPLQPIVGVAPGKRTAVQTRVSEFEEASIRLCDPDHLPSPPPNGARGGGAGSVQMTPNRLNALCMTVATLIRWSYGYSPMAQDFNSGGRGPAMQFGSVYGFAPEDGRRVRGGPDWVRSDTYTIEAVATGDSPPNAETMRGPMLRRLLEQRFQLTAHVESESIPAFALTVAKGGLKIKPVGPGACDPLPGREGSPLFYGYPGSVLTPPRTIDAVRRGQKPSCGMWGGRTGRNEAIIGGDIPLESLLGSLGRYLGGVRVINRTGVTDRFNYILEFVRDENTPGIPGTELPPPPDPGNVRPAATIFTALEEQLGLRLERFEAARDFVVIDHIERPSPN